MPAAYPAPAQVHVKFPGLCAAMWNRTGCTAYAGAGRGGLRCYAVVVTGRCLFTLDQLADLQRQTPAASGKKK